MKIFDMYINRLRVLIRIIFNLPMYAFFKVRGVDLSYTTKIASGFRFSGKVEIGKNSSVGKDVEFKGNIKIGKNVIIGKDVILKGNVVIGDNCCIEKDTYIGGNIEFGCRSQVGPFSQLSTMPEGRIIIGDDVQINTMNVIGSTESVTIKNHCIFAPFVQITDASHGYETPGDLIKHAKIIADPVIIYDNVWLGSGVMVMKGVSIGKGSVIGANSVVKSTIPAMSIAYGTPAKVARSRGV